jgi:hypothetical protein
MSRVQANPMMIGIVVVSIDAVWGITFRFVHAAWFSFFGFLVVSLLLVVWGVLRRAHQRRWDLMSPATEMAKALGALAHASGKQHRPGDRPTAVGHSGDFGGTPRRADHLARPALAPQLHARLVYEAEPVQAAARKLSAGSVQR